MKTITTFLYLCVLFYATAYCQSHPEAETAPSGSLTILSTPPHGTIVLNGTETGHTTPALITNVPAGLATIEVTLADYLFAKRQINVIPDTTITVSFELISLSDTTLVAGDLNLGVLGLSRPPVNTPYLVDNKQVYLPEITLNSGKHHVVWEGGNVYTSFDTIVDIFPGKYTAFSFSPQRLHGTLTVSPFPSDAEIYINNRYNSTGELAVVLSTGTYVVDIRRNGFYPHRKSVTIEPDKQLLLEIDLQRIPDRDDDGFLDSCDRCPEQYGLYGGCPEQYRLDVLRRSIDIIAKNFALQPLTIMVNTIGYIYRRPTNLRFRELLSYFNDGSFLCNNYNGLTLGNSYTVSYRGMQLSCELGQWLSNLEYKKNHHNPLIITTGATDYYVLYRDTSTSLAPRISFPGTALSCGFNFAINRFNCSYALGYQWENIKFFDLITRADYEYYLTETDSLALSKPYDGPKTSITFSNNFWYHQLRIEYDLAEGKSALPTVYISFALPFGPQAKTGWHTIHAGLLHKFSLLPGKKHTKTAQGH